MMAESPIQKFLEALHCQSGEDAKQSGSGWQARCPAHEDSHPSLSIAEGDGGRVLVKCHAGCDPEAICAALDLKLADLMPADVDRIPTNPGKSAIVSASTPSGSKQRRFATAREAVDELERRHGRRSKTWTYQNTGGEPVGMIVRWDRPDGKDIRPVARHSDGWAVSGMSEPRPLYRLPELAEAKRVYVTEGEKAADSARALGIVATTSPHGSKSARKADWSPLAGKEVIILPDNDRAGRSYADNVAEILANTKPTPTIKIIRLPGVPEGGDVVDWIDAHGDSVEPGELRWQLEAWADATQSIATADLIRPKSDTLAWQPFPVDVLPQPVRGFVVAGAKAIGCDQAYIALPLLASLASAIGNTRRIQLKRSWTESHSVDGRHR